MLSPKHEQAALSVAPPVGPVSNQLLLIVDLHSPNIACIVGVNADIISMPWPYDWVNGERNIYRDDFSCRVSCILEHNVFRNSSHHYAGDIDISECSAIPLAIAGGLGDSCP